LQNHHLYHSITDKNVKKKKSVAEICAFENEFSELL
jgi:hypothetical protein